MYRLSNNELLEIYHQALKLKLERDFIELLEKEIKRRPMNRNETAFAKRKTL